MIMTVVHDYVGVLAHVAHDLLYYDSDNAACSPRSEIGGAGAFAAVGSSIAAADDTKTLLVAGVGHLQQPWFKEWCSERQIESSGLFDIPISVPVTEVRYRSSEERTETPLLGMEHFIAATPLPQRIPKGTKLDSVYLFHNTDPNYWNTVLPYLRKDGLFSLWEIAADACFPRNLRSVRSICESISLLTINRYEAQNLAGSTKFHALVETLNCLTVVHSGADDLEIWDMAQWHRVPVCPATVVDPTGGGNSFSGALAARLRKNGSELHEIVRACAFASAAAAEVISVFGSPVVTDSLRFRVRSNAEEVFRAWRRSYES